MTPKTIAGWEKEFSRKFVRDDGLMDKYYCEGDEQDFMATVIKSFIHSLLSSSRLSLIKEVEKKVEERIIHARAMCKSGTCVCEYHDRNGVLSDFLKLLEEMK